ncbi:MAG: glycosyl transferase group 1 [Paucimonas sp.]|nr:glycosyl transferase group 1 [Paucimonas sp.]
MRILFIHQNFPGQFKHLAPALAAEGHQVVAISNREGSPPLWKGVRILHYRNQRAPAQDMHPWLADFEPKVIRAETVFRLCRKLKQEGFSPDVVVAHPGWGESLFVKQVWPQARLGVYCEFFYNTQGADVGFDPEFPLDQEEAGCRIALKNMGNLMHFQAADAGLSPTAWQASTFPAPFRERISIIHDGIDTDAIQPRAEARLTLAGEGGTACVLDRSSEVVTFVNRNLEPYRGYHIFVRALPALLQRRPNLHVLLVGGDGVSYGDRPPAGKSWRNIYFSEIAGALTPAQRARVHFLGTVPYPDFVEMLQLSSVHVYLTYPFVLSWSLLEAMSAGCAIIGSNTPPVAEVIKHGQTGLLTDFFDGQAMVEQVCSLLDDPHRRAALGQAARAYVRENLDLKTVCLPAQMAWIADLGT